MQPLVLVAILAAALGAGGVVFALITAVPWGSPTVDRLPDRRSPAGDRGRPRRLADVAPRGYIAWLERQILFAGKQQSWSAGGIILFKLVAAGIAAFIAWLVVAGDSSPIRVLVATALVVLAFVAPEVIVSSRADDRRRTIERALPDTLDQMTIATEAGLGFDAAMQKAATNGTGPLADELVRVLQDQSIGRSRRDAYEALALRTNSEDLRRFIRAISQADAFGISVAEVLRVQAGEMRIRRRQKAEEQAMKVPVKVVFPLVLCILPVLFIVIMTPAVIGIIDSFSGL